MSPSCTNVYVTPLYMPEGCPHPSYLHAGRMSSSYNPIQCVPMPEECPHPSPLHTGDVPLHLPCCAEMSPSAPSVPKNVPTCLLTVSGECPHLSPHGFGRMSPPIPLLFWEDVLCSDLSPCSMIWGPLSPTPHPPCATHHPVRRAGPSSSTSSTPSPRWPPLPTSWWPSFSSAPNSRTG